MRYAETAGGGTLVTRRSSPPPYFDLEEEMDPSSFIVDGVGDMDEGDHNIEGQSNFESGLSSESDMLVRKSSIEKQEKVAPPPLTLSPTRSRSQARTPVKQAHDFLRPSALFWKLNQQRNMWVYPLLVRSIKSIILISKVQFLFYHVSSTI